MSKLQIIIDSIAGAIGAVLGFMYGEVGGLFYALVAFMALDYITGIIIAVINKNLSSEVGFKENEKKLLDKLKSDENVKTQIYMLSPEEKDQWQKAMFKVYEQFYDVVGKELIDQAIATKSPAKDEK